MNKDEERFHYAVSARLGPPPTTLFLGIEILQETERGEAVQREQGRWNCLRSSVNILIERGNMRAVLSYIYNIEPTSYHSFLGYRDITGDGEKGGGGGSRRDGTVSAQV
jgi:hypothetical protein